ncbi:MAG TPA: hypothetical protein DD473_28055, partial [Planctomycetaceae bacterium]|nr:hypothetical protein [Planctomycetaceae bacterium]
PHALVKFSKWEAPKGFAWKIKPREPSQSNCLVFTLSHAFAFIYPQVWKFQLFKLRKIMNAIRFASCLFLLTCSIPVQAAEDVAFPLKANKILF